MATQQESPDRVVIDVRHTRADETVVCIAHRERDVWAKYVITAETRYLGLSGKTTLYMCRKCLEEFLTLADGIGVG